METICDETSTDNLPRSATDRRFGNTLFNFEGPKLNLQNGGKENSERPVSVRHGGVAQLGEHLPCKQGVDSSNLFISTRGRPEGRALKAADMGS